MEFTSEEAILILDEMNTEYTDNQNLASALRKLVITANNGARLIECGSCDGISFIVGKDFDDVECPLCGWDPSSEIEIGNRVILPEPDSDAGEFWVDGETGIVIGETEIDGEKHVIVTTNDGKTWHVPKDDVSKE